MARLSKDLNPFWFSDGSLDPGNRTPSLFESGKWGQRLGKRLSGGGQRLEKRLSRGEQKLGKVVLCTANSTECISGYFCSLLV